MDRTFLKHKLYKHFITEIKSILKSYEITELKIQKQAGAVLNACWVLDEAPGCYFKLPKPQAGGGSIWDFAATSCIIHEAGALVSDFHANSIQLNRLETTFMNKHGVLFASNKEISDKLLGFYKTLL
jgi:3'-phosphoadenosine 5'-phosphosulfate (PAPS) 3'-phosphatase